MATILSLNPMICNSCGKKLAEIKIKEGVVSIKCKCGTVNVQETKTTQIAKSSSSN
jgi:phage FluMu protein Com